MRAWKETAWYCVEVRGPLHAREDFPPSLPLLCRVAGRGLYLPRLIGKVAHETPKGRLSLSDAMVMHARLVAVGRYLARHSATAIPILYAGGTAAVEAAIQAAESEGEGVGDAGLRDAGR